MDWDGIGTFALFLASGGVGLGFISLMAYRAKLKAQIEIERLKALGGPSDEVSEQLQALQNQLRRLEDRVEFNERLLEDGSDSPPEDG